MKYKSKLKNLSLLVLFAVLLIPTMVVSAASNLKLYYNKKNVTYTGQQVNYALDKKTISKKAYPGIIFDGVSLCAIKDLAQHKLIGASYQYNSATGSITIKKDYTTIKMTIGSRTATIDGKLYTMPLAPMKVKYRSKNITKIMVPARFIFESLGYTYNWNSKTSIVTLTEPASSLNLYYDNKSVTYRKAEVGVEVEGEEIDLSNMPGLIFGNVVLVQAKKVFASSNINASYTYNSGKKQIVMKKDKITIQMTLGSNTAFVNGVETTILVSPKLIKNKETKKSYVMVPCSIIADLLGYEYKYNNAKALITLDKTPSSAIPPNDSSDNSGSGQEDSSNKNPYFTYNMLNTMAKEYQKVATTTSGAIQLTNSTALTEITSITKDANLYTNKEVYVIQSKTPIQNAVSNLNSKTTINITMEDTICKNKDYTFEDSLIHTISASYNSSTLNSKLLIRLNNPNVIYNISLSEDQLTMYLTIYYNYLEQIQAKLENTEEIVTITALTELDPKITEDETSLEFEFPYTINGVGEQNNSIPNGLYLRGINVEADGTTATITIKKTKNSEYQVLKSDNIYTITLFDTTDNNIEKQYAFAISLPTDVSFDSVIEEDLYYKKQFKIKIPGNHISYYENNKISTTSNQISNISLSYTDNQTEILVSTNGIKGYKLSPTDKGFTVTVGDPKDIYEKIVVLDPGHGGKESPGTIRNNKEERHVTFDILYNQAKKYFDSSDSPIKAYWTRQGDYFVGLEARGEFASEVGADLFISLHMNSVTSTSPNGTEVYYSNKNNGIASTGLTSQKLASEYLNAIIQNLGFSSRGVKTADFVVIKHNTVPAILIELGFMSNSTDYAKLINPSFQQKAAKTIYDTTINIFNKYPTGR